MWAQTNLGDSRRGGQAVCLTGLRAEEEPSAAQKNTAGEGERGLQARGKHDTSLEVLEVGRIQFSLGGRRGLVHYVLC